MTRVSGLGLRFSHLGDKLLPHGCRHAAEHQVLDESSYNDGGLRVVVHEWFCCLCQRVVRREVTTCDIGHECVDPLQEYQ